MFHSSILEFDNTHSKAAGYSLIECYSFFTKIKGNTLSEVWPVTVMVPSLVIL